MSPPTDSGAPSAVEEVPVSPPTDSGAPSTVEEVPVSPPSELHIALEHQLDIALCGAFLEPQPPIQSAAGGETEPQPPVEEEPTDQNAADGETKFKSPSTASADGHVVVDLTISDARRNSSFGAAAQPAAQPAGQPAAYDDLLVDSTELLDRRLSGRLDCAFAPSPMRSYLPPHRSLTVLFLLSRLGCAPPRRAGNFSWHYRSAHIHHRVRVLFARQIGIHQRGCRARRQDYGYAPGHGHIYDYAPVFGAGCSCPCDAMKKAPPASTVRCPSVQSRTTREHETVWEDNSVVALSGRWRPRPLSGGRGRRGRSRGVRLAARPGLPVRASAKRLMAAQR